MAVKEIMSEGVATTKVPTIMRAVASAYGVDMDSEAMPSLSTCKDWRLEEITDAWTLAAAEIAQHVQPDGFLVYALQEWRGSQSGAKAITKSKCIPKSYQSGIL